MNIIRVSRNVTIIALILSLLFHASTIFYLFMQKTGSALSNHIEQQEQAEELKNITTHDDSWVETKARAGNFGAPVFFQNTPMDTAVDTPTQQEEHVEQFAIADKPETQDHVPQEEQELAAEFSAKQSDSSATEKLSDNLITKNETSLQSIHPKATPATDPSLSVKKQAPRKKRTPTKPKPLQQNSLAPAGTQKPPLSLAQLTQGFLHHIEQGGTYGVSMMGKKTGLPSAQQMMYERYLQKLEWCVQNSFMNNRGRSPLIAITHDTSVHLWLELHQNGTIKKLALAKTSGNTLLDKHTIFIFQDASSSFPPVPQALNPFSITCMVPFSAMY